MSSIQGQRRREGGRSSEHVPGKDLGIAATPTTVSGDAPTAPSVYMCEMFARVALVLRE